MPDTYPGHLRPGIEGRGTRYTSAATSLTLRGEGRVKEPPAAPPAALGGDDARPPRPDVVLPGGHRRPPLRDQGPPPRRGAVQPAGRAAVPRADVPRRRLLAVRRGPHGLADDDGVPRLRR